MKNIIFGGAILDNLWLELLLAMTHILNLLSTFLLNGLNSYEAFTRLSLQLSHLKLLRSTVYVFIYKEKKMAKSIK